MEDNKINLETIIQLLPGNIYWKDREGRYLGCNQTLANILNLSSCEDIIGKTDYDFLDTSSAKVITEIDNKVMCNSAEICVEEIGLNIVGDKVTYLTKKLPLHNNNENVVGVLGISLDITEIKKRESDLEKAREQALLSTKAKTEFMLNMSHDIRTPLCGIQGLSNALYESEENSEKKEILRNLVISSGRLMSLLNQILDASTQSGSKIIFTDFNIRDIVNEVCELVGSTAEMKKINLITHCSNAIVTSDKLRLHRILLNLVGNALKFTEKGSITIYVENYPKLKVVVKDTGIGIPKDKIDFIFERFSKLELSHRNSDFIGSGIGLHLSKKFARELDGDIVVESEVGIGSKFTCTIPLPKAIF